MELIVKPFDRLSCAELYEILKSRSEIFMLQQHILCQDMDDIDYVSHHFFVREAAGGRVIACLRAYYVDPECTTVKIGRVLTLHHGQGTGRFLLEQSLSAIRDVLPCRTVCVDAQKHAVGFYGRFGFVATSDDFLEEGVVHVRMEKTMD